MKTIVAILFLSAIFWVFPGSSRSFAQGSNPALAYLETIGNEYEQILADVWDYTSTVAHSRSARKIDKRRKDLMNTILSSKKTISKMAPFEGDASLRDSVVNYLQMSYDVLNEDYAKIMDMEEVAERSYDMMEAYILAQEIADKKLEQANNGMSLQYKLFAANHNINIIENEDKISVKMKAANQVIKYYNVIYLIMFKSNVQNQYLYDALAIKDVNAMEQNKNALIKSSEEGLVKLDTVKSFRGDVSLKNQCREYLEFYISLAKESFPVLIEFQLKNENFEKIKTAYESKKQSEITQTDVDQYNESVKEINEAVNEYNKVNNELNEKQTLYLNKWNKTVQAFMDKYVPKKKGK